MKSQIKCVICNRVREDSSKMPFCSLHNAAYRNLVAKYGDWKIAYHDLSPKEFLEKLMDNEYSGKWVKEVVREILSHEDLMQTFLEDLAYRGMRD